MMICRTESAGTGLKYFHAGLAIAAAAWYIMKCAKQHGALAQMVARYIRIVEATGSNPVCSTKTLGGVKLPGVFFCSGMRAGRSAGG